jgi:hypothetical protein
VGEQKVSHSRLSEFRVGHRSELEELFTDVLGVLSSKRLVTLRVMKMADGGFRPAYNVQMASAGSPMGGPRTIAGMLVTNVGSDMGSVSPMLDQIERRTGKLPKVLLADANHKAPSGIIYRPSDGTRARRPYLVVRVVPVPVRGIVSGLPGSENAA